MFRALVVDDVPVIRQSIACQVNESAYNVITAGIAENGEKALHWLGTYHADICITDVRMPVIDGFKLIKKVKELYPWITFLVVSSYDEFSYARTSIQLEAVDYILKPINQKNLDDALNKSVEKIERSRRNESASVLFSHMSECNSLLGKWVEILKINTGSIHNLILETMTKLSDMAGKSFFLLEFLTEEWLSLVANEMKVHKPEGLFLFEEKTGCPEKCIKNTEIKEYLKMLCIRGLENGIKGIEYEFSAFRGNQQSRVLEKIMKYIENNYTRSDLTLQELADHVLFSKNHMANIFKQETGMTIWNYIIDLRMKKAKELLAQSHTKNIGVAMSVGYTDYIHFSRLFKEHCGISANEYRKKVQGKS